MKSKLLIGFLITLTVLLFMITVFLAVMVLDEKGILDLATIKQKFHATPAPERPIVRKSKPSSVKPTKVKTTKPEIVSEKPKPTNQEYRIQISVHDPNGQAIENAHIEFPTLDITERIQHGRWTSGNRFKLETIKNLQPVVTSPGYQVSNVMPPQIDENALTVKYDIEMRKIVANAVNLHLTLIAGAWGLLAPLQLKQGQENLALIDQLEKDISIPKKQLATPLRLEGDYYQPVVFQVDPNQPNVTIRLQPRLVTVQVKDSMGIYTDRLDNIQVFINGKLLQKTNARGEAVIPIPKFGPVTLTFFKQGIFPKQKKTIVIRNSEQAITIPLVPAKHLAIVQFVDEQQIPIPNEVIEITGQRLSLRGKTDKQGVFRLSHWYLKSDVPYRVRFPRLHIERRDFIIEKPYYDTQKLFTFIIPLRFDCLVEADDPSAQIEIINAKGERVSHGVGKLSVSLPQGTYKVVATRNGVQFTQLFDPKDNTTITIRTRDIVEYLRERIKQGYHPTKEEYQDLWNYPTDGPHYVESLYMAGTLAMENKEYVKAYQAFNRYAIANPQAKYDVLFLIRFGETALEMAKGGSAENRVNILEKARQQLLTAQTYYKEKITIKKRREIALRIYADLAEVNFELFNIYKEMDNFNYERAARDTREAIEAFNLRYQAAENENGYEVALFKKQYLRLADIHEALDMAY